MNESDPDLPAASGADIEESPTLTHLAAGSGEAEAGTHSIRPTVRMDRPEAVTIRREQAGDFIGPYRLMEQVGVGGFGAVWRAEQTKPVHREVALKLVKPGMDSHEIIARFEAERQALAMMDHPNIARMFDGGTTDLGRPYFVMEFVKGESVVAFCDARKISIEDRIPIFLDICSAVQHAHQKAILHRDLKPSNIIVTESGDRIVPKVIDFGVAKALGQQLSDKTMFTVIGLAIGTPQYMSPEQSGAGNLDVDTRSDVYSLGVILYELLTGSTPLRREEIGGLMFPEVIELLRSHDPERPSTRYVHLEDATRRQVAAARQIESTRLQKHLSGDLDWIVMRALEKDRNRRYQTVNDLALDLQRYLKGDAVEAGPPSASYRLGKLARRYRSALLGASLVFASILVGLGFTVWQAARATKAEKLASQRLGEAEQARDAAENLISEAVYGLRKKLMALGKVETLQEMVTAADRYYRRLPVELYDDDAKRHLASLSLNRAIISEALGQDAECEQYTREALRITELLSGTSAADEKLQDETCYAMLLLCYLYMDRNDNASLIPMADAVVARCDAWLKDHPKSLWAMYYQVLSHNLAAQATLRYLRRVPEGMARFLKAAEITKQMRAVAGETAEVCEAEGFIHYGYANVAGRSSQPDVELSEFEASTASFARALELGGDSALLREMHVGALHHAGGLTRRAARSRGDAAGEKRGGEMIRQAFETRRKLVELEPGRAEWWRDLGYSYRVLGDIARDGGDMAGALQNYREELRCRDEAVNRQARRPQLLEERSSALSGLAGSLLKSDPPEVKQAAQLTLRALEDWRRAVEMSGYATLQRLDIKNDTERLGKIAAADPATALPWLASARQTLEPLLGKLTAKNDLPSAYHQLLGHQRDALTKLGRTAEAAAISAALDSPSAFPQTPQSLFDIGKSMREATRSEHDKVSSLPETDRPAALDKIELRAAKAHTLLEEAVAKEPANLEFCEQLGYSWLLKGRIERTRKRFAEAGAAFEKALGIFDPAKHSSGLADTHFDAGEAQRDGKDFNGAAAHYRTAIQLRDARCAQTSPPPGAADFSRASQPWTTLASTQLSLGDLEASLISIREAAKRRERAHEMEPGNRGFHWELLQAQLEVVIRLGALKQDIPPIETAAPALNDLPALLKDETDRWRLVRLNDHPLSPVSGLLRDQKRLSDAAIVLRHIIALRERIEALGGSVSDFSKSSISARINLANVLALQKLPDQAAAETQAAVAAAETRKQPALLVETHLALRAACDAQGRQEDAERHARLACEVARKDDVGWRGIRAASELCSTLIKRRQLAEGESIGLAAWEKASAQKWPDEPVNLRADLALRIGEVYHSLHMEKPDPQRDDAARVWVRRAAESMPLERQKTESDFNNAMLHWMPRLAQLADENQIDEYHRQRSAMLASARGFKYLPTLERVAKSALVLPAEGAELKQAAEGAAEAFRTNPGDEWMRVIQCLALLRTGKAQECLDTAQPMLKTGDTSRACYVLAITALAHRQLGRTAEAEAILTSLEKDPNRAKHLSSPTQRDAIVTRVLLKQARAQ